MVVPLPSQPAGEGSYPMRKCKPAGRSQDSLLPCVTFAPVVSQSPYPELSCPLAGERGNSVRLEAYASSCPRTVENGLIFEAQSCPVLSFPGFSSGITYHLVGVRCVNHCRQESLGSSVLVPTYYFNVS